MLVNYLKNLTRENLLQMALKAKTMSMPNAAQRVAEVIKQYSN